MKRYDLPQAYRLYPLLRSIASEYRDRRSALVRTENQLARLTPLAREGVDGARLFGESALQRRELNRVVRELDSLGCSILDMDPVLVSIPSRLEQTTMNLIVSLCERN